MGYISPSGGLAKLLEITRRTIPHGQRRFRWSVRIIAAIAVLGQSDARAQALYSYSRFFPVGALPLSVATADLNGDGALDVVTANLGPNDVSVLIGNGDGSLQAAVSYPTGTNPRLIAVADLNSDDVPDLVTAADNNAGVLLGNGDGSFRAAAVYFYPPVRLFVERIAIADRDGDGILDIVASARLGAIVLLGNGDGSFELVLSPVGGSASSVAESASFVAMADLNGDAIADRVTCNPSSGDVSVSMGRTDGTFEFAASFAVGDDPRSVVIGDLDGVYPPEIVTANSWSNDVTILHLLSSPPAPPRIDIKPGSDANWIDPARTGILPVAVFGSEFFDVTDIDVPSIEFGPAAARPVHDLSRPGVFDGHLDDVDGDGFTDLITHYRNLDTGIRSKDVIACLSCRTFGGLRFEACDSIRTKPREAVVETLFSTPERFPAGASPDSIAAGDFNGDGVVDLVTASSWNHDVNVLLGNGDGSFHAPIASPASSRISSITVADFDRDGTLDVAATYQHAIGVLLGNGDGSFRAITDFPMGTSPHQIVVADFDGDSVPDIVTAGGYLETNVLLGNGDGSFRIASSFAFVDGASQGLIRFAAADFDGDSIPDLAATIVDYPARQSSVSVRLNRGDGTFEAAISFPAEHNAESIVAADFDGDGDSDVAISSRSETSYFFRRIGVWRGDGNGGLEAGGVFEAEIQWGSLAASDFNNDGVLDLYTSNLTNDVSVLLGNGDGSFQAAASFVTGGRSVAVVAGDVDGDGLVDLVTANDRSNSLSVLLGQGDGSFDAGVSVAAGHSEIFGRSSVAVADLDGDGVLDIVSLMSWMVRLDDTRTELSILLGSGNGRFRVASSYFPTPGTYSIAVVDVDGDRIPDIVTGATDGVSVLVGNGDGSFLTAVFLEGGNFSGMRVADVNGDGVVDLVGTMGFSVSVLLGNGDGTFQAARTSATDHPVWSIALGDFDGDKFLDIAAGGYESGGGVSVLPGNGDGGFNAAAFFPSGDLPSSVATADMDGDRVLDLIAANESSDDVSVLLGNGDGTFQAPARFATGDGPRSVAAADFDGDGVPDVVTTNLFSDDVSVLLGNGDGSLQAAERFAVGEEPTSIAVADLDGDDAMDLVAGNARKGTVTILLNQCDRPVCSSRPTLRRSDRNPRESGRLKSR